MIAKPEWFGFRFGGKDPISIKPCTWQGWVYFALCLAVLFVLLRAPDFWILNAETRRPIGTTWGVLVFADVLHVWYQKMKERHGWGKK